MAFWLNVDSMYGGGTPAEPVRPERPSAALAAHGSVAGSLLGLCCRGSQSCTYRFGAARGRCPNTNQACAPRVLALQIWPLDTRRGVWGARPPQRSVRVVWRICRDAPPISQAGAGETQPCNNSRARRLVERLPLDNDKSQKGTTGRHHPPTRPIRIGPTCHSAPKAG